MKQKKLLPANFRRMVSSYVGETDEFVRESGHRPARLCTRKRKANEKETGG